jgi:hypothetical protein
MTDQGQGGLQILSKLVLLEKGLHLFRIIENPVAGTAFLGLGAAPVGSGRVDFFPAESVTHLTLRRAGDCIVVRVSGDRAGLLVTEYQLGEGGGDIKLRIDRVATDFPGQAGGAAPPAAPVAAPAASTVTAPQGPAISVKVLGHIGGRGDLIATDGWIGQPGAGALEGFAVKVVGLPPDLKITYSCRPNGARSFQTGADGEFVGSRGKNNKINALKFSLAGPGAEIYQISGEVHFNGAGVVDIIDGDMLAGGKEADYVCAFRLAVAPRRIEARQPIRRAQVQPRDAAPPEKAATAASSGGRQGSKKPPSGRRR